MDFNLVFTKRINGGQIMERIILRGAMYYATLEEGSGSEQCGTRPVLIIQNDVGNKYSGTVIIAAITSKLKRNYKLPTHYRIQAQFGLSKVSYIMLEQIQTIDKARLTDYIGTLNGKAMRKVNHALAISVGLK